jgi:hypothetical protein
MQGLMQIGLGAVCGASAIGIAWYSNYLSDSSNCAIYTATGKYYLADYDNIIKQLSDRVLTDKVRSENALDQIQDEQCNAVIHEDQGLKQYVKMRHMAEHTHIKHLLELKYPRKVSN